MSAKHTAGPWKAAMWKTEGGEFGWSIYAGDPAHLVPTNTFETNSAEEAEANARLIAKAPELLEALQRYVSVIASGGAGDRDLFMAAIREADDAARAVIAAATGDAS